GFVETAGDGARSHRQVRLMRRRAGIPRWNIFALKASSPYTGSPTRDVIRLVSIEEGKAPSSRSVEMPSSNGCLVGSMAGIGDGKLYWQSSKGDILESKISHPF